MPSFLSPTGRSPSTCGYCHSGASSSISTGLWAHALTPLDYKRLLDRGWRRSGKYLYRPDLTKTCCPALTIRLPVADFIPSKSQKRVVGKWRKFIATGKGGGRPENEGSKEPGVVPASGGSKEGTPDPARRPPPPPPSSSLQHPPPAPPANASQIATLIHSAEHTSSPPTHQIRTTLSRSAFCPTSYALYVRYQTIIHHDAPSSLTPKRYTDFLVTSPLSANNPSLGSFHQKYYIDDTLIAVAVLDVLPGCLSSVYFFYEPDYSALSLGTLSALKEIVLAEALRREYYYMGYYIHTCQKMRPDHADSRPQQEARSGIVLLAQVENDRLNAVSEEDVADLDVFEDGGLVPFETLPEYQGAKDDVRDLYALLGGQLIHDLILVF
ncbi:Arginyl-tRNA--protein transferase 1 [Geranomyces variabilis]|uniref:arginyltransferase n=1 Tax=Geranomyces variabilis TaxID=109894 RepID=A0AAD5XVF4_9FUNG|nr:Arginyl-tRNA--protein transferase 1 [Geranomyces variabilis]